ncbi:12238_t:CDS:1 [Cetraspora pellucida]|uniref:12238_t:CDS:1 n=1 Tax=Cetraspora pellucida TaxID=1433469 RepID=A0ACA9KN07_9GLOM|nr:12238_t:CDS:1 [Cetraspora pellucida]
MGQLKPRNRHLKESRKSRECEQWKIFQSIKNNPQMMLNHFIPTFAQLSDDDFSSIIKKLFESREVNINVQKKLLDHLISTFGQLNDNDFIFRIKSVFESREMNIDIQKNLLDYLIPTFTQLEDADFNSKIKKIFESWEMNTYIQRKRNDIFLRICNLPDIQVFNVLNLFQTITYPQGNHKGEIISTYLQKKACEFVDASLYKQECTIDALELKNKNLE